MNLSEEQKADIAAELAEAGVPPDLIQWLAKLKLLYGIPFHYLVPNNDFLPPETIRFFSVDPDWIASLTDGAMSIGRHYNGADTPPATVHSEVAHNDALHAAPTSNLHNIRRQQLSMEDVVAPVDTPTAMSGFLLNSVAVQGWKSMDVAGYPKGSSPSDYEKQGDSVTIKSLPILRLERLSPSVMLGIFQGPLYELVLHQPPEAIHFGFQEVDDSPAKNLVVKNLRVPTTNWDDPDTKYDAGNPDNQNQPLDDAFVNPAERVLDMTRLSKALAAKLAATGSSGTPGYYQATPQDDNFKDHLVASDFGLEMVHGVGLVSFINE